MGSATIEVDVMHLDRHVDRGVLENFHPHAIRADEKHLRRTRLRFHGQPGVRPCRQPVGHALHVEADVIDDAADRAARGLALPQVHVAAHELHHLERAVPGRRASEERPEPAMRVEVTSNHVDVAHHDARGAGRGQLRARGCRNHDECEGDDEKRERLQT
jgi:hypothetical protein